MATEEEKTEQQEWGRDFHPSAKACSMFNVLQK